jgi:hypothetical protein
VTRYLALLDQAAPGLLEGLYLVGSVALDDFRPGQSNIDFVAVTAKRPSAGTLGAVETVHRRLALEAGPAFDGFYIERTGIGRQPDPHRILPYELGGHFHRRSACFETNPVTWAIWRDHGIAVRGPEPSTLGLSIDPVALIDFAQRNLAGYWTDWVVAHWGGPADAALAVRGVLGVLRLAHVLATGLVASKTGAGRWALKHFKPFWHPIIREALAARRGRSVPMPMPLARYHAALDFVAFVVTDARTNHPLR